MGGILFFVLLMELKRNAHDENQLLCRCLSVTNDLCALRYKQPGCY